MGLVGTNIPRSDGLAKVTGQTLYADDFSLPGLYHGMTVRSPHPHARLACVRWNESTAPPDAVCVLAQDIRGRNGVQLLDDTWPVLADRIVRHVGEPVALVAARTRQEAREAMKSVVVEYEELPPVLTLEDAGSAWAESPLHEIALDNAAAGETIARAAKNGAVIVESCARTGHQEHIYIECQGMTAWFDIDGVLNVVGSMQCPFYVLKSLLHTLGIPRDRVQVEPSAVGGGFGGKEEFPSLIAIHAALLTRACGQPVRIVYDRGEDIVGTTKRHPSVVKHRSAFDKDGRILATECDVTLDGGAYRTLSPVVLSRAVLHATGAYRVPQASIRGRVLRTNTAPNGAFRGFGAPQVQFAMERHLDEAGRILGVDPYTMRHRNALRAGDALPSGQIVDETTSALACLEEVERRTKFRERWSASAAKASPGGKAVVPGGVPATRQGKASHSGLGISLFMHGAGFTGNGERKMHSPVTARVDLQGTIEILTANTEMGQGCDTVFAQIAAESTGLRLEDIVIIPPNTRIVPDSGPTVASRTTMIVGALVGQAALQARDEILLRTKSYAGAGSVEVKEGVVYVGGEMLCGFRELARKVVEEHGPFEVTVNYVPPEGSSFDEETYRGDAYAAYSWGACVAELQVEPSTLAVNVRKVTSVCEVGRAIHPEMCRGQIEGGLLQSIGHALWEEMKLERGAYVNRRLATYIVPTFLDAPTFEVTLLEKGGSVGPFGAKGVGELPLDGGAAAVVQAIEHATGIVADEIPATPEKLWRWKNANGGPGREGKATHAGT